MSKTSIRSKASSTRLLVRRMRKYEEKGMFLKPFGFCCSIDDFESLMNNDKKIPQRKCSLPSIHSVHESPVLKFHTTLSSRPESEQKKKSPKGKQVLDITDYNNSYNLNESEKYSGLCSLRNPIRWLVEDEIAFAKDTLWEERQRTYNEEMDKNAVIGKRKTKLRMKKMASIKCPRWYQDFSIDQMKTLMTLQDVLYKDYEEMVTGRTQKTLRAIGIVSSFFKIVSKDIRKLQESCKRNVIEFLREIYKVLTGHYFEDEGYKKSYDCNERIILSAIAFLTFPETIVELHRRLPPVKTPKFPPKPIPPMPPLRRRMNSPYKEELFQQPDWASYLNNLQRWRELCRLVPIPKIILPSKDCVFNSYKNRKIIFDDKEEKKHKNMKNVSQNYRARFEDTSAKREQNIEVIKSKATKKEETVLHTSVNKEQKQLQTVENAGSFDIPRLPDENKVFDFTINGLSEKPGPVEYKICGTMKPPQPNKKSWLGEKDVHYIISGAPDNPPSCPITYEMTGIANVTPSNSDERFLAVLKLGDGTKKIYPSGRKNLSKNWQEWLQNADEEFREIEREANRMIKSIEATMRLVFPDPTCDSCCSCRQTRKSHIKARETKAPYFVIDTIAEDGDKNKFIVGSMALHSPAPTPPESTVNLLEVIASEDVVKTNVIINGVTNEKGRTQYFISGSKKDTIHMPSRIVEHPPPRPLRNVPPCVCTVHQIFNKGLSPTMSHDNIPWTKDDGLCFGKKYRPDESPAYSCKMYPGDKSCRRNPFMHDVSKLKRKMEKRKLKAEKGTTPAEKKMYSIADFRPCGDEHGMGVCGGPWGALNTLTPAELEEEERLRKEILRGPPCGTKPGRAVCAGPFGARIPIKRKKITVGEEEIIGYGGEGVEDEEDEEDEEEEEEEEKQPVEIVKEKVIHRGKECYMSPESIAERTKVVKKKVGKFIPDPNYHGYDDLWNIFRTAPSEKESDMEYEKTLKLSSAEPRSDVQEVKKVQKVPKEEGEESVRQIAKRSVSESIGKKGSQRSSGEDVKKRSQSLKAGGSKPFQRDPVATIASSFGETSEKVVRSKLTDGDAREEKYGSLRSRKSGHAQKSDGDGSVLKKLSKETKPSPQKRMNKEATEVKAKEERTDRKKLNRNLEIGSKKGKKRTLLKEFTKKATEKTINPEIVKQKRQTKSSTGGKGKRNVLREMKVLNKRENLSTSPDTKKTGNVFELNKSKGTKHDKKKETQAIPETSPSELHQKEVQKLKNMMKSSEYYPYDIKPAVLPEEPSRPCQRGSDDEEDLKKPEDDDDNLGTEILHKGPCGWRTKSEQELPTKKNLIYLTEADYPMDTIPVRPGGKPCLCRENRDKKKIMLYNIGGLISGKRDTMEAAKLLRKKKDEEEKKMQVIEGVIYYTPPPSPRRSDEYVPEYDLYKSPYDMCLTKRKDENLKLLEKHSGPKSVISKVLKNLEPCGCNNYIDFYGVVDPDEEYKRTRLMQELQKKTPKEQWKLALKDTGLIDYFTRCRDSLPCWLKCAQFNRDACSLSYQRLKMKRPVCECKYERKVLEHKEEKIKWRNRQEKLKSLKKQPFMNIVDTARPIEPDTKLMISGVKRIPRDDEYVDDIKYCITGVAENYTMAPPKQVVAGLNMATPIQTPEPSKHDIPCVCLHRHWSPVNVPPGPLPRKDEALIAERKRRHEALEEAYRQIYTPQEVYDTHTHSCKDICNSRSARDKDERREVEIKEDKNHSSGLKGSARNKLTESKLMSSKKTKEGRNMNPLIEERKEPQLIAKDTGKGNKYKNKERTQGELRGFTHETDMHHATEVNAAPFDEDNENSENAEADLFILVKAELKKMAVEGFLFAKLPKCYLMPQLQYWIMYRKGVVFTDKDKRNLVRNSIAMWSMMGTAESPKIQAPSLQLTKRQLRNLTFDDAESMKHQIAKKEATFYSQVRKARVMYARSMWNTMEYGKFPSTSFKKAFFTYMAGKEADGHVFKPWLPSEVCEMV